MYLNAKQIGDHKLANLFFGITIVIINFSNFFIKRIMNFSTDVLAHFKDVHSNINSFVGIFIQHLSIYILIIGLTHLSNFF